MWCYGILVGNVSHYISVFFLPVSETTIFSALEEKGKRNTDRTDNELNKINFLRCLKLFYLKLIVM